MIHGKVQTFNRITGTGFISPDAGGQVLPFRQIDVYRRAGDEVREQQRFSYEISRDSDGEEQAINLRPA
ncbi:cold-shock protein [Altererythrobacter sp. BO-6]|nr:cold-shock protein [Altererythrobacter sp. BO-6]